MARTKQTARKLTGGKAPRKNSPPRLPREPPSCQRISNWRAEFVVNVHKSALSNLKKSNPRPFSRPQNKTINVKKSKLN